MANDELAADIKERGLLQPIVLDAEDRILDGRNRLAACEIAGVKPTFVTYADGDADGYALAVNIARRHLKPGARHLVMEMARRLAGGKNKKSYSADGIYPNDLSLAAVVLDFSIGGDLRDDVLSGDKGLQAAAEIARERKRIKQERDAKKERLKEAAPDLYALVADDDKADVDEAIAALEVREAKTRAEALQAANEETRLAEEAKEQGRRDAVAFVGLIYRPALAIARLFSGAHLGLDDLPSWIVVTETNDFLWPGPDLWPLPGTKPNRYDYGMLPPRFFTHIRDKILQSHLRRRLNRVQRSE